MYCIFYSETCICVAIFLYYCVPVLVRNKILDMDLKMIKKLKGLVQNKNYSSCAMTTELK